MITVTGEQLDDIKRQVDAVDHAVLRIYRRGPDPEHFQEGWRRLGCIIECDLEEVQLVFENAESALEYIAGVLKKIDANARRDRGLA